MLPEFFRRRRLAAAEQLPDKFARAAQENARDDIKVLLQQLFGVGAKHSAAHITAKGGAEYSGEASTRFYLGLPLANSLGHPCLRPSPVMPLVNQQLLYPQNMLAAPVAPTLKPYGSHAGWHDNRFASQVGNGIGPFARQQEKSKSASSVSSPEQHIPVLQMQSSSQSTQNAKGVRDDPISTQQLNTAAHPVATSTVPGEHGLLGNATTATTKTTPVNVEGRKPRRLQDGRQFFINGPTEDLVTAGSTLKVVGSRSEGSAKTNGILLGRHRRRLEGLDFIPGCWEEEVQTPIDWTCDPPYALDREQFVCIRVEFTGPNIVCDGKPQGDFCVHEVQKPPQWYCPLDPPPSSKEKKDKHAKDQLQKKGREKEEPKSPSKEKPKES
ncbi:uncharacterized protein EMH_0024840 [Eimeria mitis]|uniref:Uncharacterized protein n=1 Tax=Eimeria mitis TaxID=44415 RepID=U6KBB6_9EIME|nr:uncharacterized protein EMH_0024840 [Eimeria mitis]CDJ35244.1 hypothetical protein, conserved [Eimeria mitis]